MLLLDLDDTLIDHTGAQRIPNYSAATFPAYWEEICTAHFEAFTRGEISFVEQRRRRLRDAFNEPTLSAEEADLIFTHQLKNYEASWTLFADVMPFLEKHAGFRLAILTNGQQAQQELKLKKTELDGFFEFVLSDEATGMHGVWLNRNNILTKQNKTSRKSQPCQIFLFNRFAPTKSRRDATSSRSTLIASLTSPDVSIPQYDLPQHPNLRYNHPICKKDSRKLWRRRALALVASAKKSSKKDGLPLMIRLPNWAIRLTRLKIKLR